MNKIFAPFLPPWVETGLQPAFYDMESGTVLQQTARMYAKVQQLTRLFNELSTETKNEIETFETNVDNRVTEFENSVNTTVQDYIDKFVSLKDFVEDYFDNLDVQEEINNKLDAMVDDGTLQTVIEAYLQPNVTWTFDTVSDMKLSSNLIDGTYARTLGYHSVNDGGGAVYKISNSATANEMDIIAITGSSTYATLVYGSTLNAKQFGAYADGTTATDTYLQRALNVSTSTKTTLYIPDGTYLLANTLNFAPANNLTLKLGSEAKLTASTNIGSLIDITSNVSFFRIEGGIFDGNQVVDYGIRSLYTTNKYSPTYQDIYFYDFATSSMIMRDSTHAGGSEHGYILGCKFYNQNTLATCLSIYTHDYTIDDCELFYTNTGIVTSGFLVISNTHIWAGGAANTNDNTVGIFYTGDRLMASNMYFDGMNTCIDTNSSAKQIYLSNSTCLFPNEGTYSNPSVIKTHVSGRVYLSNIDIKAAKTRVQTILYSSLDIGNINNYTSHLSNVFKEIGNYSYDYTKIDFGDNIYIDNQNSKPVYKGWTQTLANGSYYQIGYIVLRPGGVSGFDLQFVGDDINKYNQRVQCTLYNTNNLDVAVNSNISEYSGEEGRMGIAVGNAQNISDGINTIKACPIYLHVVNSPGNGFGISVTSNGSTVGNCVVFNPFNKFNSTAVASPSLLFDDVANTTP